MGYAARAKAKRPRVVIGYPVGGTVTLPFHASMVNLAFHEMRKPEGERDVWIGKSTDGHAVAGITHTTGLYVSENRTLTTRRFLDATDAEWLLQIDTDIEFPPTLPATLMRLAGSDKRVLAASVPLGEKYPSCAYRATDTPGRWANVWPVPEVPIEVDGIATAVALIHRSVFDELSTRNGQSWWHHIYLPKAGQDETTPRPAFEFWSQGEDLAFSARCREAGIKQWCVTVPGLKHFKTVGLSHDSERGGTLPGPAMRHLAALLGGIVNAVRNGLTVDESSLCEAEEAARLLYGAATAAEAR